MSDALKRKQVSPMEVTKKTLEAIFEKDEHLNAYITVMEDEALKQAGEAEKEIMNGNHKGPLHGIPVNLKDLIYTKGVKTTSGSEIYKDFIPDYDAEIVTRLRRAGAVIMGKVNMHEFAYGTTGDRSYFGPVRNPHDPSKITGGSSSGSGAAVAAGLAYGSIGSDTGGSIRIPASCCGIVGMKPTFGRVSKHGSIPLCWTLDHLGPMTRTVKDNALLLNAISGFDEKDPYSVNVPTEDFTADIGKDIKDLTIGIPTSFYFDIIQPEVKEIFEANVEKLEMQGANIEHVDLDYMEELLIAQSVILTSEAYAALETEIREQPEKIEEEVRGRIINGINMQAVDYIRALKVKHAAVDEFLRVLDKVDTIMTPTLSVLPSDIEQREIEVNGKTEHPRLLNRLTGPTNTTGLPSISVPGGTSQNGLPVGVQFIGRPFAETSLYRFARQVEVSNE